jgi:hypothetical protein
MANSKGLFVQTVEFGPHTLQISFGDGTRFPIPYDYTLGYGFSTDGTTWICDPLDNSYTDGKVRYLGVVVLNYHLDKNGAETSTTVAGIAKFKVRMNFAERKVQYMRCDFNNDIFNPGYKCPHDWITLHSW